MYLQQVSNPQPGHHAAVWMQTTAAAYIWRKQLLLFAFALHSAGKGGPAYRI